MFAEQKKGSSRLNVSHRLSKHGIRGTRTARTVVHIGTGGIIVEKTLIYNLLFQSILLIYTLRLSL